MPGSELTGAEAQKVYECMADKLHSGYKKGGKGWVDKSMVDDYRGWTKVSSFPAAPGVHGDRFLLTWVNKTGAAEYLKYAEEPNIPARHADRQGILLGEQKGQGRRRSVVPDGEDRQRQIAEDRRLVLHDGRAQRKAGRG